MSKSMVGQLATLIRDIMPCTEQYVSYDKSNEEFIANIIDEAIDVEYESEKRNNVDKVTISIYSPLDNDRESVYDYIDKVKDLLETVLNEPYEGGIIRQVTNVRASYRGVTTEKAIVYSIVSDVTSETNLR